MEKPRAVILVLFALVLVFNSDPLMAQTADPGATTNQKLANEIVALRKRVEQLEKQNAELRGTIRDTKNKRSVEPTNMNGAVATADANVYAADLPRKAAPFVPAQVSDWSGVYMGIEGGYGWGKQSTDAIDPGAPFSAAFTSPSLHPGEVASLIPPTSFPDLAIPSTKQNGWLLGGFFGAQKQWGSWVLGIEGDIDGANIRGSGSSTASLTLQTLTFGPFPASPSVTFTCPGPCATLNHDLSIESKIDLLASLRGKVGWSFAPDWLLYGTGGAAFAHAKTTVSSTQSAAVSPSVTGATIINAGPWHFVPSASPSLAASGGTTMFGWAAGAGIDWKFWHDAGSAWVFGVEYLHYGFPEQTITVSNNAGGSLAFSASEHIDTVKARMSYQFSIH